MAKTIFAVGDIHGRADLLEKLQKHILDYVESVGAVEPEIVYCGDSGDRGPQTSKVFDLLIDGLPNFHRHYIKGNHDDMMLSFVRGSQVTEDDVYTWLQNGGLTTLASYGIASDEASEFYDDAQGLANLLLRTVPSRHIEFLKRMRPIYLSDEGIFVHAGLRPNVPLDRQKLLDLMWIREPFLSSTQSWGKMVYHGHTPSSYGPQVTSVRVNIDTAAYATGILTSVLVGAKPHFICASQPRDLCAIIDPLDETTSYWQQWAVSAISSSGARDVIYVGSDELMLSNLAKLDVVVKNFKLEEFCQKISSAGSEIDTIFRRGLGMALFPSEASSRAFQECMNPEPILEINPV